MGWIRLRWWLSAASLYAGRLKTFAIGFGEKSYDERPYARQVATRHGTEHHEIVVTPEVEAILPELVWHGEEPTADSSMVPVYYLSRFASQEVKVVLSGDGADEILAGYPTYQAHFLLKGLQKLPSPAQKSLHRLAQSLPVSHRKVSWDFKLKRLTAALSWDLDYAHYSWRRIWDPEGLAKVAARQDAARRFRIIQLLVAALLRQHGLKPHALRRYPFLSTQRHAGKSRPYDYGPWIGSPRSFSGSCLVELAARFPDTWKLKGLIWKKYLLRRLLKG